MFNCVWPLSIPFPDDTCRYFEVDGKTLKVKTKLSQRVGVEYYIEVLGINDRLSTRPLAMWKYNITTCVKNVYAPHFLQVCILIMGRLTKGTLRTCEADQNVFLIRSHKATLNGF